MEGLINTKRTHGPPNVKASILGTSVETKRISSDDAETERIKASKLRTHREACARRRQAFERGKREKMMRNTSGTTSRGLGGCSPCTERKCYCGCTMDRGWNYRECPVCYHWVEDDEPDRLEMSPQNDIISSDAAKYTDLKSNPAGHFWI